MTLNLSFLAANEEFAVRQFSEDEDNFFRTKFVRDRDRVLFSKEFRRLQGKTQVFVAGFDDHIRTRLTHTLIVSQISQTIAKYFCLNETIAEAIALAHDVGHTPFGHVGERTLNLITNNCDAFQDFTIHSDEHKGFKHNWQGVKVVSSLEKISPDYKGLNLTDFTRWGILHHSRLEYKDCKNNVVGNCTYQHKNEACVNNTGQGFSLAYYKPYTVSIKPDSWTLEALIVRLSDEIAQRYHDIEDGLLAGIIDIEELIDFIKVNFSDHLNTEDLARLKKVNSHRNQNYALHNLSGFIIKFYCKHLINTSYERLNRMLIEPYQINKAEDFYAAKPGISGNDVFDLINFDPDFQKCDDLFQKYLYKRILNSHLAQSMDGKSTYILRKIISAYLSNPKQLPDATLNTFFNNYLGDSKFSKEISGKKSPRTISGHFREMIDELHNSINDTTYKTILLRTVTDFIAGMTDAFAINQFNLLYKGEALKNY